MLLMFCRMLDPLYTSLRGSTRVINGSAAVCLLILRSIFCSHLTFDFHIPCLELIRICKYVTASRIQIYPAVPEDAHLLPDAIQLSTPPHVDLCLPCLSGPRAASTFLADARGFF